MAIPVTQMQAQAIPVYNALVPPEGPRAIRVPLDFSALTSYSLDFSLISMQAKMSVVQCFFVDNYTNADSLNIDVSGTPQSIHVPPFSQGYFPVLGGQRPSFVFSAAGGSCSVIALNVPMPSNIWYAPGSQSIQTQQPPLTARNPALFTVVTGGTAVSPIAPGSIIGGAIIANPLAAAASLFVDFVNAAGVVAPGVNGTTIEILPGGSYIFPARLTNGVTVNSPTSGATFTCVIY